MAMETRLLSTCILNKSANPTISQKIQEDRQVFFLLPVLEIGFKIV